MYIHTHAKRLLSREPYYCVGYSERERDWGVHVMAVGGWHQLIDGPIGCAVLCSGAERGRLEFEVRWKGSEDKELVIVGRVFDVPVGSLCAWTIIVPYNCLAAYTPVVLFKALRMAHLVFHLPNPVASP